MTYRVFTLLAIAMAFPGWNAAQNAAPAAPSGDIVQDLRTMERKWTAALVRSDVKLLEEVLDDNFFDTDDQGNRNDRAGIIAALKSGDLKVTSIQLSGMTIHSYIYSAVVAGRGVLQGTYKGQKLPPSVSFTDTFIMLNGAWKLVASHRSAPHAQ